MSGTLQGLEHCFKQGLEHWFKQGLEHWFKTEKMFLTILFIGVVHNVYSGRWHIVY